MEEDNLKGKQKLRIKWEIGLYKESCFGKEQTGNFLDPEWDVWVEDMYSRVRLFERGAKIQLPHNKVHT